MWTLAVPIIVKFILPLVLAELQRFGLINEAEIIAAALGMKVIKVVNNIKIYDKPENYPSGKNGEYILPNLAKGASNGNYNKGD